MKKAFVLFSLLISVLFLSCDLEPEEEQKLSLLEFQKTCIEMNIGDSQTVYKYKDGSVVKFNDGNTFIQITPLGEEIKIEGNE